MRYTSDKVDFYGWITTRVINRSSKDFLNGHDRIELIDRELELDEEISFDGGDRRDLLMWVVMSLSDGRTVGGILFVDLPEMIVI